MYNIIEERRHARYDGFLETKIVMVDAYRYVRKKSRYSLSWLAVCPPFGRLSFSYVDKYDGLRRRETDEAKLIFIYEKGSGARFVCLAWKYTSPPSVARKRKGGHEVFAKSCAP